MSMLIIKNKVNTAIEINKIKIYPGENKEIPNIRINQHIRNLMNIGVIGVSEISDTTVISTKEDIKKDPKLDENRNNENLSNKESSIDLQEIENSIEIPINDTVSPNKRFKNSKGDK